MRFYKSRDLWRASVGMSPKRSRLALRASRPAPHHFVARSTSPSMFALTIPTTCVAAVARPGPERPRGARGASLAGRHVGSTGGDRVAMRVGGARSARSVRTAATEGTRGSGFAPRRRRHRAPNDRRNAERASASVHARASPAACRATTASIHFQTRVSVAKGTLDVESGRFPVRRRVISSRRRFFFFF